MIDVQEFLEDRLNEIQRKGKIWFYRPRLWWFGWQTFSPVVVGHDEYSRKTIMLGWTITGRIVIPIGYCGDLECYEQSLRWAYDDEED